MKTSSFSYYFVERKCDGVTSIITHSIDEDTQEAFYKFKHKIKAQSLLSAEKEIKPTDKYRIVTIKTIRENGAWE